jgi:hypothetical protein
MYLVIYFFVPSREVYLHDVTNMYLVIYRFVWRLTFDCAQMCFPKRHPPYARERLHAPFCLFIFTGIMRVLFCEAPPPLARLSGMMTEEHAFASPTI